MGAIVFCFVDDDNNENKTISLFTRTVLFVDFGACYLLLLETHEEINNCFNYKSDSDVLLMWSSYGEKTK